MTNEDPHDWADRNIWRMLTTLVRLMLWGIKL